MEKMKNMKILNHKFKREKLFCSTRNYRKFSDLNFKTFFKLYSVQHRLVFNEIYKYTKNEMKNRRSQVMVIIQFL